jgi:hypothetical protein
MEQGQILRNTELGEIIYNLTKRDDVLNIVEIGTWYGLGSTKCIIDGIIDSNIDKNFISIELNEKMYELSKINLKNYSSYVNLLNGSIISYDEMFWFDFDENKKKFYYERSWYDEDLINIKKSNNVLSEIPDTIDLLILDGGEFSTYPEWNKLKNRTKIVVLDDINVFKCYKIFKELSNNNCYIPLYIVKDRRNGFCAFEKKIKKINKLLCQ